MGTHGPILKFLQVGINTLYRRRNPGALNTTTTGATPDERRVTSKGMSAEAETTTDDATEVHPMADGTAREIEAERRATPEELRRTIPGKTRSLDKNPFQ